MKKISLLTVMGIAIFLCGCTVVGDGVLVAVDSLGQLQAGVDRASMKIDGGRIIYSDSGVSRRQTGFPVVLIHGITTSRGTWNAMMSQLGASRRLLAVDVAGHGESDRAANGRYDAASQAQRIAELLQRLGIERHHIAGHSMGGAIAGRYTIIYPDRVVSLGLFSSLGIENAHPADLSERLDQGKNPMFLTDEWGLAQQADYVTEDFPLKGIVPLVAKSYERTARGKRGLYRSTFDQVNWDYFSRSELASIEVPVFLLWGERDRVLKPSAADEFESRLLNAAVRRELLPDTGHMVIIERARESARLYRDFLSSVE